jgi:hypothetical protein
MSNSYLMGKLVEGKAAALLEEVLKTSKTSLYMPLDQSTTMRLGDIR